MAVTSIAMHEGIERGASRFRFRVCIGFGNGKLPPKAKTVPNAKTQDSQGADIIDVVATMIPATNTTNVATTPPTKALFRPANFLIW